MRLLNLMGREMTADDWVLWVALWSCMGLLVGGLVVLLRSTL